MKMFTSKYIVFIGLVLLFSCSREDSISLISSDDVPLGLITTTTLITVGVTDGQRGIEGAKITNFSEQRESDSQGLTVIGNAVRNELGFTIKVEKDGYLPTTIFLEYHSEVKTISRMVLLEATDINSKLVDDVNVESFEVSGVTFNIAPSSFVNLDNSPVDGDIDIHSDIKLMSSYLLHQQLISIEKDFKRSVMSPMFQLQMVAYSKDGARLKLAEGQEIDISIDIKEVMKSNGLEVVFNVPSLNIGYLSLSSGLIVKGNDVTLIDDRLEGKLGQLGTIYLGGFRESKEISVLLTSSNDLPLVFAEVIVLLNDVPLGYITNEQGGIQLNVAEGTELEIIVAPSLYAESIDLEVVNENSNYGVHKVGFSGKKITGEFVNCSSSIPKEGYVLSQGRLVAQVLRDGSISGTYKFNSLEEELSFLVTNTTDGSTSTITVENVEVLDLGQVFVCGSGSSQSAELKGYVRFDADDNGLITPLELKPEVIENIVRLYDDNVNLLAETTMDMNGNFSFGERDLNKFYQIEIEYLPSVNIDNFWTYSLFKFVLQQRTENNKRYYKRIFHLENLLEISIGIAIKEAGTISGSVSKNVTNNNQIIGPHSNTIIRLMYETISGSVQGMSEYDRAITDGDGSYIFENVPNRKYQIELYRANDPLWELIQEGDATPENFDEMDVDLNGLIPVFLQAGEDDQNNNFRVAISYPELNVGNVSGKVLQSIGNSLGRYEPYEGESLALFPRGDDGLPEVGASPFGGDEVTTDADGYYSFVDVPPGEYVIRSSGNFVDAIGFLDFDRLLDGDETPEMGVPLDADKIDGFILVDVIGGEIDSDNNFIFKFQ